MHVLNVSPKIDGDAMYFSTEFNAVKTPADSGNLCTGDVWPPTGSLTASKTETDVYRNTVVAMEWNFMLRNCTAWE